MFMKKSISAYKFLIRSSAALLLLLVVVLIVLFSNRDKADRKAEYSYDVALAVPTDAPVLFLFKDIAVTSRILASENLFGRLTFGHSSIRQLIDKLYSVSGADTLKGIKNQGVALSLHYSSKDEVSPLLVLKLKESELIYIQRSLREGNNAERRFNGITVRKWNNTEYAISGEYFIASPSSIILESSIRHIISNSSILDSQDLSSLISETQLRESMLFVNHSQTGKLFSAFAIRRYLKYSDFVSRFTSWSALEITTDKNRVILRGTFLNSKGPANYSEVFTGGSGLKSEISSVIPHNAFTLLTISVDDISDMIANYKEYSDFYKRPDEEKYSKAVKWFTSLGAKEVGAALVPFGSAYENIIVIKSKKPFFGFLKDWLSGEKPSEPLIFPQKGYMEELFGDMFKEGEDSYICFSGEFMIIGREELLKEVFASERDKFTLDDYISQTKAHSLLNRNKSLMSLTINGSEQPDSLIRFFRHQSELSKLTESLNLMIGAVQLTPDKEGEINYEIFFYGDSLKSLPQPGKVVTDTPAGWERDTVIRVPAGPYELINFSNGEREYLEQLPNYWLRLSDKNMKGIWAVPFQVPVRGYVQQVDYFRNGKLQMLFAGGNRIFLLDRSGRFVSPYPLSVDSLIMLGPRTYDVKDDGDFAIMLLHTDNVLRLYDKNCKPYPAWSDISLPETIREFPELKNFGGNHYWILRTSLRTMIYNINGIPVTDIREKNRLKPDSPVISLKASDVLVQTLQNRSIVINLETGEIKRYKQ
jgi:hypothetical protein